MLSCVVGPKVAQKAHMTDRANISIIYFQGKKNCEWVSINMSIYSIIVYATNVPIKMPSMQDAKTKISAS